VKKHVIMLGVGVILAGCEPQQQIAEHLATNAKDSIYETSYKIHDWAMVPPPPKAPNQPVRTSYCYHTASDILCYRQPMPGWEGRLVAYQGTDAAAPPPAIMQPLPKRLADTEATPESRVAKAMPVFDKPPSDDKDKDKEKEKAAEGQTPLVVDPAHELLPDPALAPQL
jgi:hypothetical protein